MTGLEEIIKGISLLEQEKTNKRMSLAAKLYQAIMDRGWSIDDFANTIGKKPELVREWLSGTFNFDLDTIAEVEYCLGIRLVAID